MGERVLGEFEHQVLLAILREGSESYSVEVVLELERRTEREVATAAVYVALTRLERKDFVSSRIRREWCMPNKCWTWADRSRCRPSAKGSR